MYYDSLLAPSLANMFMCALEDCPSKIKCVLYHQYVNNTFCLFKSRNDVDIFLNHINSYHPNINVTLENERDQFLSFLDAHVPKENHKFSTSLFGKSTFTGLCNDFSSLSPSKCNINLFSILFFVLSIFFPHMLTLTKNWLLLKVFSVIIVFHVP